MTTKRTTKLEWQMAQRRLARAVEAAEEIVDRLALTAPIDPLAIAHEERHCLRVKGGDFRSQFDGQLEYHPQKKRFVLFYNTKYDAGLPEGQHHPRTRFSIAHELGHYFLERHHTHFMKGGDPHQSQSERFSDTEMEREADSFASGLLLPSNQVRPIVNERELSLSRVEVIAAKFGTSLVSTALRGVQLSDYPCAVVGIRAGQIAWSFCSKALIDAGLYPPERGSSGPSTLKRHVEQSQIDLGKRLSASGTSGDWFRTFDRDDLGKFHVEEHWLAVPVLDTVLVLLSVPEEELEDEDDR
jgi:hypothetical protein